MLFEYTAIDQEGNEKKGTIDATSRDSAIGSLQRRGFIVSSVTSAEEKSSLLSANIALFERVSNKEIVILSRQIATLFGAQVSALRVFRLLAAETGKPLVQRTLTAVADDIQGGSTISKALAKHPKIFSPFYVNMVFSGEESGKLDESFTYLADYLDRTYEMTSRARNALIYPAFIVLVFIAVVALMLTLVIPRLSTILIESGQDLPIYTQLVIGISNFFVTFSPFIAILLALLALVGWRYKKTERGAYSLDAFKLSIPYIGTLYRQLYLTRIAETLQTTLTSGVPLIRALEITSGVVGNAVYEDVLHQALASIKGGASLSEALEPYPEIPGLMVSIVKVGEETGQLGAILESLAKFYHREVNNSIEKIVSLIEPVLIIVLAVGVGFLLASILIPIYTISSSI